MEFIWVLVHVATIWMLAVVTPGANVLLTISTALNHDRLLASYSALGVCAATSLWALFGSSSLVIAFTLFPQLYVVMKVLGGSYLIYLGLKQLYKAKSHLNLSNLKQTTQTAVPSKIKIFLTAFITSILNPKTGFFVVSLFSVSLAADQPQGLNLAMIVAVIATMSTITLCWHLVLAFTFSRSSAKAVYQRVSKVVDYVTGGIFTILGVKVIAS
ncbi:lysine transporter LysE [Photobacterium jeanii]|uniref:Lysine transporter LysE n=1 Tax=Photobacterium jeanii TaxID=858640 RepID=A0A178K3A5_9GAMM|nr:LysE family transporter [Photobacterium jeanii]OAN11586.1 lysine transporter LysE [Photobacterium jeanii]PST91108.1 lysine transporter LysE [Photobacterium jeanii]